MRLKNVVSCVPLRECGFARGEEGRRVELVLDMRAPSEEAFRWLLRYAGTDLIGPEGVEGGVEGEDDSLEAVRLGSAEVWVDSEERKEEVLQHLRSVAKGLLSEAAVERRIRRIKVEVRGEEDM